MSWHGLLKRRGEPASQMGPLDNVNAVKLLGAKKSAAIGFYNIFPQSVSFLDIPPNSAYNRHRIVLRFVRIEDTGGFMPLRKRLSAVQVTKVATPGMYHDGGGLYLQVTRGTSGVNRSWILRYMLDRRPR